MTHTTSSEFQDTQRIASYVGLQLIQQNDARNGPFRLLNGPRIVAHSSNLRDLQEFAWAWRYVR